MDIGAGRARYNQLSHQGRCQRWPATVTVLSICSGLVAADGSQVYMRRTFVRFSESRPLPPPFTLSPALTLPHAELEPRVCPLRGFNSHESELLHCLPPRPLTQTVPEACCLPGWGYVGARAAWCGRLPIRRRAARKWVGERRSRRGRGGYSCLQLVRTSARCGRCRTRPSCTRVSHNGTRARDARLLPEARSAQMAHCLSDQEFWKRKMTYTYCFSAQLPPAAPLT